MEVLLRLAAGGVFLAVFLLIDWGLVELAKLTLGDQSHTVDVIVEGIQIGSALGALVLFVIHTIQVIVEYVRWK